MGMRNIENFPNPILPHKCPDILRRETGDQNRGMGIGIKIFCPCSRDGNDPGVIWFATGGQFRAFSRATDQPERQVRVGTMGRDWVWVPLVSPELAIRQDCG